MSPSPKKKTVILFLCLPPPKKSSSNLLSEHIWTDKNYVNITLEIIVIYSQKYEIDMCTLTKKLFKARTNTNTFFQPFENK